MWIIILLACVSVILPNNAQEQTSFEAQTVTETSYSNNDANWDITKPYISMTIQNGRTDSADRLSTQNAASRSIYSNDFKPIISFGFNRNTESNGYVNENERPVDRSVLRTFLHRPDSETNNSVPYLYSQVGERNEYTNVPVSYSQIPYFQQQANFTPVSLTSNTNQFYSEVLPNESSYRNIGGFSNFDFYRNTQNVVPPEIPSSGATQPNFNLNQRNFAIDSGARQTSSSEVSNSDSIISRTDEQVNKPISAEEYNTELVKSKPIDFYRNTERFFQPVIQAYYPRYSFLPYQRDGTFQPILPYPIINPNLGRAAGLEVTEKRVLSDDAPEHILEHVPSATSTDIIPPQPLVLPHPLGLYPPSFASPLAPNIPPYRFAFNPPPVVQPTNVPREDVIVDASSRPPIPPPIVAPGPQPFVEILPEVDSLPKEGQTTTLADIPVIPQVTGASDETPNSAKIPYEYGFDMTDGKGNYQHRKEISDISGGVQGSYGYINDFGHYRFVTYRADRNGFRAFINSNEPGVASSGSADVVVVAERPPPTVTAEERAETEQKIIVVPDTKSGDITQS